MHTMLHRILVATDDDDLRVQLAFTLHEAGFDVLTARTSVEGRIRAADGILSAAVLDLDLHDSASVLDAVRAERAQCALSVVAIGAEVTRTAEGIDAYHSKPVNVDDVVESVENLVDATMEQLGRRYHVKASNS